MGLTVQTTRIPSDVPIDIIRNNPAPAQFRSGVHLDAGDSGSITVRATNGPARLHLEWDADFDEPRDDDDGNPFTHSESTGGIRFDEDEVSVRISWATDEPLTVNFGRVRSIP